MGCDGGWSGYGYINSSYRKVGEFLTIEEKIELLKEYQKDLEQEAQGVSEKIKELELN